MSTIDTPEPSRVHYDHNDGALYIGGLKSTDKAVLREARRWSTGERGEPVEFSDLDGVDLTQFAREALGIGARVLGIAAQSSDTLAVQQAVKSASEQVNEAIVKASADTDAATRRAADSLAQTARDASERLIDQVAHLVGGENPELLARLQPVLDRVGADMETQVAGAIERATSAQHEANERRHNELADLIRAVHREVEVKAAAEAAAAVAKSGTTLKGFDFEEALNVVLHSIAAAMGEEYTETGDTAGRLRYNKKGDGVLTIDGGAARIVFEAHDGSSKDWGPYLAEAERNRDAAAAIGVVRRMEDNAGQLMRVIAPKRLIVAFDPATDDPELLRTVILLMRTVAMTTSGRFGVEEIATANEHIREALAVLSELDEAKKSASAINSHVEKIENAVTKTMTAVQRELNGAVNALTGAAPKVIEVADVEPLVSVQDRTA